MASPVLSVVRAGDVVVVAVAAMVVVDRKQDTYHHSTCFFPQK